MASCNDIDNTDFALEVFEKHGDFIRSIINFQVRDPVLADDIFQDLFLTLLARPIPEKIENIRSFLYRTVINDIIDAQRRMRRYQGKIRGYIRETKPCSESPTPPASAWEHEERDKMFRALENLLPPREAQAVILRYRDDYNIRESALKMNINTRSVSQYLSMGLKKLREALGS